jgi:hypothetical protein
VADDAEYDVREGERVEEVEDEMEYDDDLRACGNEDGVRRIIWK